MNNIHTIILSDLHLSDAEPLDSKKPLWKKFKNKNYFIDAFFNDFLKKVEKPNCQNELVLNGDIFDFDSVMAINKELIQRDYEVKFGHSPFEEGSIFKIDTILKEHIVWVNTIRDFIKNGNKVIFVIGNHDLELMWNGVQKKILEHLALTKDERKRVIFCEWFYVSNQDTLIEHGNQYDPYCMTLDPINPLIKKNGRYILRLPFGNLANRFMINVMGLKNPHDDSSYVKTFKEFVKYFFKYELKMQPLIVIDWLNGALKTLLYSVGESFLPRVKDPHSLHLKIKNIAKKANVSVETVLKLRENHAHPAVRNPLVIIRELWLDRAFLLLLLILFSWQIFTTIAVFISISFLWFFLPLSILLMFFGYYANGVHSDIKTNQSLALKQSIISAKICKVKRVVLGHTHHAFHKKIKNYEVLNTGTWSRFFSDVECNVEKSQFHFVILSSRDGKERTSKLYEYDFLNKKIIET